MTCRASPVVALAFPSSATAAPISAARLLRERYGFTGEVRAVGDVLREQAPFMVRCGFDAFEPADGSTPRAVGRGGPPLPPRLSARRRRPRAGVRRAPARASLCRAYRAYDHDRPDRAAADAGPEPGRAPARRSARRRSCAPRSSASATSWPWSPPSARSRRCCCTWPPRSSPTSRCCSSTPACCSARPWTIASSWPPGSA